MHPWSRFLTVIAVATIATTSPAQSAPGVSRWVDSIGVLLDSAMRSGDATHAAQAAALAERVLTVIPNDPVILHYRGYALYRQATLLIERGPEAEIRRILEEANTALEASANSLQWPETYALRSSVYGQLIGLSPGPITAMRYGPRADREMDRAVELGPRNPRVWLLRGIGLIFKPGLFGGGADKAERDIRKALELFPTDTAPTPRPAWGYAEAWAWLGQALARQNRRDEARAAYHKALEIQPEFGWVTHVLLPALDKPSR